MIPAPEIEQRKSLFVLLRDRRSLLLALLARDLRSRYAGSVGGGLWALVHPLILLGLYSLVFELVFRVKVPQLGPNQPYVLFIAVALWPWLAFQDAISRGTMAVQQHAALVKKVAFEHELLVYSATLASFIVHSAGYCVVLLVLGVVGYRLQVDGLWLVPWLMVALWALATGLALLFSALQVFVRDIEQVLSQGLVLLFYATPVLYTTAMVPSWMADVLLWNPVGLLIEPIRDSWLSIPAPAKLMSDKLGLMVATGLTITIWWVCRRVFYRLSPYFEDVL